MLTALFLAAATATAADPALDPTLGRYAVRQGLLTVCTLSLSYEPTVGGEVEADKGCISPLHDFSRWSGDGKGGFTLTDPLRKRVATALKDHFGYTLFLRDVRRFDMVKLRPVGSRVRTEVQPRSVAGSN